jgi:hypothetical protein
VFTELSSPDTGQLGFPFVLEKSAVINQRKDNIGGLTMVWKVG